jgi:chromosome condensin MukBEF MukE localization factor
LKKDNERETVSIKELLVSNTYTQEAIINLLDKKGIINRQDIFDEIIRLRDERIKTNRRETGADKKVH